MSHSISEEEKKIPGWDSNSHVSEQNTSYHIFVSNKPLRHSDQLLLGEEL